MCNYADGVSFFKFIQKNGSFPTVSNRGCNYLPNPIAGPTDSYAPINGPTIDDMMDFFRF